jgi:hypothetical protein
LSLLSVAAQVYGRGWNRLSAFQKVQLLLFGEPNLSVDDNIEIFKNVQQYIENNTWVRGNTRFISSVEHDISRVSAANE